MQSSTLLKFDEQLYSVEAIQKAAYRSMQYLTAEISLKHHHIECILTPNIGIGTDSFLRGVEEFKKHVIDYQLRAKLKAESEPLRNLVLGIAFSNTGLHSGE